MSEDINRNEQDQIIETGQTTENDKNSTSEAQPKKRPKGRKWLKAFLWTLAILILLVILIPLCIYIPPVQRFAVDKASKWLSEETGMEISVGSFSLDFPLDFKMGDVLAIDGTDTILNAGNLIMSIQAMPLLEGKVVADNITLENTDLNTKSLIEAISFKGHVGNLSLNSENINIKEEYGKINHVTLKNSDLTITKPDSVPEDTTTAEPVKWKFDLDDINIENVRIAINLPPAADRMKVVTDIHEGKVMGKIDLEKSIFNFTDITLKESGVGFAMGDEIDIDTRFQNLQLKARLNTETGEYKLDGMNAIGSNIQFASGTDMAMTLVADTTTLDGNINVNTGIYTFPGIDMRNMKVRLDQGNDMTLEMNTERANLDGILNIDSAIYDFTDINIAQSKVNLKLQDELDLDMDFDKAALDGHLNLDTSIYDFNGIKINKPVINLRQEDMKLALNGKEASLDGKLNLETSVYNFSDILLDKADINLTQGQDLKLDMTMAKGYVANGTLDIDKADYKFDDLIVTQANIKMKQGRDLDLGMTLNKGSLDARMDLNTSDFRFDDIRVENTAVDMATADGMAVKADIAKGVLSGTLNLDKEQYTFSNIAFTGANVKYDAESGKPANGFDPAHIALSNMNADISKLQYNGDGSLVANINHAKAEERSGLKIDGASGTFAMDNEKMTLDKFMVKTPQSTLNLDMAMDMNTFDTPARGKKAGQMNLDIDGIIGKRDIAMFAQEYYPDISKSWPDKKLRLKTSVNGNMQNMNVKHLEAFMDGVMDVKGNAELANLDRDDIKLNTSFDAKIYDTSFITPFIPDDMRQTVSIPKSINLVADARYDKDGIYAKAHGLAGNTSIDFDGNIDMNSEYYDIIADIRDLHLLDFLKDSPKIELTGKVSARGYGFDPFATTTVCNADFNIQHVRYEDYQLHDIDGTLSLADNILNAGALCADQNLNAQIKAEGKLIEGIVDATANVNVIHSDIAALGLYEGELTIATDGVFKVSSDLDSLFNITASINHFDMHIDGDSLKTQQTELFAMSGVDSTIVNLHSGDLKLNFNSPHNIKTILYKYEDTEEKVVRFAEMRKLNINFLKRHLPYANLSVEMKQDNPVWHFMRMNEMSFDSFSGDFSTDPINGLYGKMSLKNLMTDSISINEAQVYLKQDTTVISFNASLDVPDHVDFDGFTASLDGYLKMEEIKVMLKSYDKNGDNGFDMGIKLDMTDSLLVANLLPEEPVLAYTKFKVNPDNYITIDSLNTIKPYIKLISQEDSCQIFVYDSQDDYNDDISLYAKHINLEKLSRLLPTLPKMEGDTDLTAYYSQNDGRMTITGATAVRDLVYESMPVGNLGADFEYTPLSDSLQQVKAAFKHDNRDIVVFDGKMGTGNETNVDGKLDIIQLPLEIASPFIPDQMLAFDGMIDGELNVQGTLDKYSINGQIMPDSMIVKSDIYSLDLKFQDKPIIVEDNRVKFDTFKIYGKSENPLTLAGYVDITNLDDIYLSLSLYGREVMLIDAERNKRSLIFGKMYGDFFSRLTGSLDNLRIRGMVNILPKTDMTYLMSNTPLSIDYRLSDIVTFVDFTKPPSANIKRTVTDFSGIDMSVSVNVEHGARFHCEFSADKQSYIDVAGEGALNMSYTPEGTIALIGKYTITEGQMKYTLPVIPLKTFTITPGSFIEFTGIPSNPTINFAANEDNTTSVSDGSGSRIVKFKTGLEVKGQLDNMELLFTIDAPEDMGVKNELANMSVEEKNKLAVAMLCTGMYLASTNSTGFDASNALNSFLQNEINNIAGKAFDSSIKMDMGLEQRTREDGSTTTDYSFKFSRRFFNERLNVIIGGKISDYSSTSSESGAYIDDVSLEWRLNDNGTRYVKLFHEKNYENLFEGELTTTGVSYIFRKKLSKLSDLWKPIKLKK